MIILKQGSQPLLRQSLEAEEELVVVRGCTLNVTRGKVLQGIQTGHGEAGFYTRAIQDLVEKDRLGLHVHLTLPFRLFRHVIGNFVFVADLLDRFVFRMQRQDHLVSGCRHIVHDENRCHGIPRGIRRHVQVGRLAQRRILKSPYRRAGSGGTSLARILDIDRLQVLNQGHSVATDQLVLNTFQELLGDGTPIRIHLLLFQVLGGIRGSVRRIGTWHNDRKHTVLVGIGSGWEFSKHFAILWTSLTRQGGWHGIGRICRAQCIHNQARVIKKFQANLQDLRTRTINGQTNGLVLIEPRAQGSTIVGRIGQVEFGKIDGHLSPIFIHGTVW
mmetsp:Transcript_524/g.1213  ORF Transcript_524/g.1213 Transcript_524/m.1213 type:complete len:330 (+) Transcript_524:34-1023(+)